MSDQENGSHYQCSLLFFFFFISFIPYIQTIKDEQFSYWQFSISFCSFGLVHCITCQSIQSYFSLDCYLWFAIQYHILTSQAAKLHCWLISPGLTQVILHLCPVSFSKIMCTSQMFSLLWIFITTFSVPSAPSEIQWNEHVNHCFFSEDSRSQSTCHLDFFSKFSVDFKEMREGHFVFPAFGKGVESWCTCGPFHSQGFYNSVILWLSRSLLRGRLITVSRGFVTNDSAKVFKQNSLNQLHAVYIKNFNFR